MSIRTSEFYEQLLAVKVKLADSGAIKKINPKALKAYVERNGWVERIKPLSLGLLDVHYYGHPQDPNTDDAVMVLPKSYSDFARRVGETITELSAFEKRSELAIYADLAESSYY